MYKSLNKGIFMLSIDTELAWGMVHRAGFDEYGPLYAKTREAIDRLLELLVRHDIGATWAVVGHLFLDHCAAKDGQKHPEIVRSSYRWFSGDWFDADPASDVHRHPFWYGSDIVERIRGARVPQELASHSFSHIIAGDPDCSPESFASELDACHRVAADLGITLRSFVFPKNRVGHLGVLAGKGFRSFRGNWPTWYERYPRLLWRIAHKLDNFMPLAPPVVYPSPACGMWDLPASYYYPHRRNSIGDWGSWLPIFMRAWKAKRGLRHAAERRAMFHMWLHPYNLAGDIPGLLRGLDQIFAEASRLREEGKLEILTMGEVARRLDAEAAAKGPGTTPAAFSSV